MAKVRVRLRRDRGDGASDPGGFLLRRREVCRLLGRSEKWVMGQRGMVCYRGAGSGAEQVYFRPAVLAYMVLRAAGVRGESDLQAGQVRALLGALGMAQRGVVELMMEKLGAREVVDE